MKIYLARPINGLSYDEVYEYYSTNSERLGYFYEVLQPMTGKGYLRNETALRAEGYQNPPSTNHAIVERDRWMVTQSDVVYCNLVGAKTVSIGCMMEMAWAMILGKHVVLAMEKGNLHQHAFVLESADVIFENHEDAVCYLINLSEGAW